MLDTFRNFSTRSRTPSVAGAGAGAEIAVPHCGQNIACWRMDTPQAEQRRAISGSDMTLNSMHRVEEVFSLSVDAHAEVLTFESEPIFQGLRTLPCTRRVGDYHHRKLTLHDSLVDVDDTATRF